MQGSDVKKLKSLEDENARLKRMVANVALENEAMKDLISGRDFAILVGNLAKKALLDYGQKQTHTRQTSQSDAHSKPKNFKNPTRAAP